MKLFTNKGAKMNTSEIIAALRERYPSGKGEWAFFTEVPNATGGNKERSCDALAMNMWPSKGLVLHGHEVKASRSDWQREIQDPSKAEAFARYCDYWWIVAPENVLKLEELPASWGWICPSAKGTRVRKPATKRDPENWPRDFLAGILRAASKVDICERTIRETQTKFYQQGFTAGQESIKKTSDITGGWEKRSLQNRVDELEKVVGDFEKLQRQSRGVSKNVLFMRQSAERLITGLQSLLELSASVDLSIDADAVEA